MIDLNLPFDKEYEVHLVPRNWRFLLKFPTSNIVSLRNWWIKQEHSKNSSHKILREFKLSLTKDLEELNEGSFSIFIDEDIEWMFKIIQTQWIKKVKNWESISFKGDEFIINKRQIKETSYNVSYSTDSETTDKSEEDFKCKEKLVAKVKSKYLNHNLIRTQIDVSKIKVYEFDSIIEELNSMDTLLYLSFNCIQIEMAIKFLLDYKGFSHLKRLVFILKNNLKAYEYAEFKEKKQEFEKSGTKINWFYAKLKQEIIELG